MFRFPNHTLKLKPPDQPQTARKESLLTRVVTFAALCVSFRSKAKSSNVFPKDILKLKALDLSIQARKKLFQKRKHVEVRDQRTDTPGDFTVPW